MRRDFEPERVNVLDMAQRIDELEFSTIGFKTKS